VWLVAGLLLIIWLFAYWRVDITSMSLHPFYKRRLCSAFALKRVGADAVGRTAAKIGQDENGIAVERDFDNLVPLSDTALKGWPSLIVCAAANVSDPAATPPGRRVTSFTFSADSVGGPLVGGMNTEAFENAFTESWLEAPDWLQSLRGGDDEEDSSDEPEGNATGRSRDLTLPTAVAVSGAAISPSMGKMTPRPLTFLLALANIRLGVWVPNPRWAAHLDELKTGDGESAQGDDAHHEEPSSEGDAQEAEQHEQADGQPDPKAEKKARKVVRRKDLRRKSNLASFGRPRSIWLARELLGRNRVDAKYLYVTDGGHYENLGLVELLRRGCTRVFCFDASDGTHGALGDAIALARSEMGVEIEIDPTPLTPEGMPSRAKRSTVTGTISYPPKPGESEGRTGVLVYARNVMPPRAPWDVQSHQYRYPAFPHDSTADQLYTDQKFEAYRALGAAAGLTAIDRMRELSPFCRRGAPVASTNHALAPELARELMESGAIQLLDIRDRFAHRTVRVRGAKYVEPRELPQAEAELYRFQRLVFLCANGVRSRDKAVEYRARGWDAWFVAGGMRRWVEDELPVMPQRVTTDA
jgi:rhodanese-related sulfurtransferase